MLCTKCYGTGKYFGLGMMQTDCEDCLNYHPLQKYKNETEKNEQNILKDSLPLDKIDRRSKEYKMAIREIMDLDSELTKEEAQKIFDETYSKV